MDSDEAVTAFLKELRAQAADRKKDLLDHHLRMSLGLSFDEFLNTHRDRLHDVHSRDIWNQIHHIDLETDLLICGFSGDEPVVIRLDRFGKTHWETNYSVVGIGSDIALAFLCQRDWSAEDGSPLQLTDCLLRIYEAKRAAEKNRHVGEATSFEILFRNGERFDISDSCFRMMKIVLDITYRKMPFQEGYLEKEAEHKPIPIEQRKKNAPTE